MDLAKLEAEYRLKAPTLARFCESIQSELSQLLFSNDITLGVPMEARIKTWDSLSEKLERRAFSLKSVLELNDLVGLRIILLFRRDVATVQNLLENSLSIVSKEDTGERLSETQFGYQSLHYIAALPKGWLAVPTMKDFAGLNAEIQVRTVAQHIWAAASHKLQYKLEQSVPVPVRRAIHRVSALLETVDLEFERVLQERDSYKQVASSNDTEQNLNVDLLASILNEQLPPQNKDDNENYSDLLADLLACDISSTKQLRSLIDSYRDVALKADAKQVAEEVTEAEELGKPPYEPERLAKGVYFTHCGLVRQMLDASNPPKWIAHRADLLKQMSDDWSPEN